MELTFQTILLLSCGIIIESSRKGFFGGKRERRNGITNILKANIEMLPIQTPNMEKFMIKKHHELKRSSSLSQISNEEKEDLGQAATCSNKCTGIKTIFKNKLKCYYDHACFETFFDCCPDYVKCCGKQTRSLDINAEKVDSSTWSCVKFGELTIKEMCLNIGVHGVWMIQKCPLSWPTDKVRFKCENTPPKFSFPVENYLPVVTENNFTYRNKYCATCNGIKRFSTWDIGAHTYVTPPAEYSLNAKLEFIVENDGKITHIAPKKDQPRRYCVVESQRECENVTHQAYNSCVNGPVEVVFTGNLYFKNKACAVCQGHGYAYSWGKKGICGVINEGFSMVFHLREPGLKMTSKVVRQTCPPNMVYDKNLKFCRKGSVFFSYDLYSSQFFVAMWLVRKPSAVSSSIRVKSSFEKAVRKMFAYEPTQVSATHFYNQDYRGKYIVATFRVTFTQFESLKRHSNNNSTNNEFLHFSKVIENFTIEIENSSWTVIKTVSKQLNCNGNKTILANEHKIDGKHRKIFGNKTGRTHLLKDYSIFNATTGRCSQLAFSDCTAGAYSQLKPHEYVILSDLSLYHNATNRTYGFGKYYVIYGYDVNHNDEDKVANFIRNSTVLICLPFTREYKITKSVSNAHNLRLWILTISGFTVSILSLLLVLITYTMFSELRTLPGKNMMNLCLSLLIFQSLWLARFGVVKETVCCTAIAILEHYFLLASFTAMSVISHNSCITFSKHSIALKNSVQDKKKTFLKYSVIVWVPTAAFVAACFILDKTNVFPVNYGSLCWLGTKTSKIYLFFLPIGFSLLFNISAFIRTVIFLFQHERHSRELQQRKKQNLLICVKLSTLTGFPWLFAFLGAIFVNIVALEYLFVIFVCFEGFYLALSFLWNSRVLKLYKNRLIK